MTAKSFIRSHIALSAIVLFVALFAAINVSRPAFMYDSDGSLRAFGVGYRRVTILPVWLVSILLGMLSYLVVCGYAYL